MLSTSVQLQGTREKREIFQNNSLSGKTQGIWKCCQNTGKAQGIWFAQDLNSLILKVKVIAIFAANISIFSPEAGRVWQVSFVYVIVTNYVNWHRENLRLDREKTEKTQGI